MVPAREPNQTWVSRTCPELIAQLEFHGVGAPLEFAGETGRRPARLVAAWPVTSSFKLSLALSGPWVLYGR